jgi:hypothetical protein
MKRMRGYMVHALTRGQKMLVQPHQAHASLTITAT